MGIHVRPVQDDHDYRLASDLLVRTWSSDYVWQHATSPVGLARSDELTGAQRWVAWCDDVFAGTVALVPWAPCPTAVAEWAQGAVEPDAKGRGVFDALLDVVDAASRAKGYRAVFGSSVTYHRQSQRALTERGLVPVGYELGLCPPRMGGTARPAHTVLQLRWQDRHAQVDPPAWPLVVERGAMITGYMTSRPAQWPEAIAEMRERSAARSTYSGTAPHTLQLWFTDHRDKALAEAMGLLNPDGWSRGLSIGDPEHWPAYCCMIQKPVKMDGRGMTALRWLTLAALASLATCTAAPSFAGLL